MSDYKDIFKKVLTEQPEMPMNDQEAYMKSFDPESGVDPESFNVEPLPGFQSRYVEKAKSWIVKLDKIADWLNGTDTDSLNKQFNDIDKADSVFEGISKASDKLTKISAELKSLSETIKGYIITADNRQAEVQADQQKNQNQ